jgi:hypothetical protein
MFWLEQVQGFLQDSNILTLLVKISYFATLCRRGEEWTDGMVRNYLHYPLSYNQLDSLKELVKRREILEAIEKAVWEME